MDLNLMELESTKHHFLIPEAALNFGHAASVCLESRGHSMKISMPDVGHYNRIYSLTRYDVTEQMKRTWGDEEYATEQGAYGIALLVASTEMEVKAIAKSRKGSGIDYWLGKEVNFLFQNKVRLEVSGIRNGSDQQLDARFDNKMRQSERSDHTKLPALIVVVEFNKPRVKTGLRNIV